MGKTLPVVWADETLRKHPHGCGEDIPPARGSLRGRETPPRVWGRPPSRCAHLSSCGNTPTGVGKTSHSNYADRCKKKHPHGCGEDRPARPVAPIWMETPPRVWGRLRPRLGDVLHRGNTPTGVGKTPASGFLPSPRKRNTPTGVGKTGCRAAPDDAGQKHPHGCGEDRRVVR